MPPRPVLLTGFAPFRHHAVNSSWEGVRRVAAARRGVAAALLPVDHAAAADRVRALIGAQRPDVVLLTGLAEGTACRLEVFGRRAGAAAGPGPGLRRGRWPFATGRAAVAAAGTPCRLSTDAGGYVCDTTYWAALGEPGPARVGFLHAPPLSAHWPVPRIARAIAACLDAGLADVG